MKKGIDISVHNGNINFNQAKQDISFVMIRASWGFFTEDKNCDQNVKACEAAQIPYGFYHYSYARNLTEAKQEVDGFLALVKKYNPTYPLVIDMEDADHWKEKNGNPSNETYVEICEYFCNQVEKAGYYAMIYANYDWWKNRLNDARLEKFDKWLADWRGYDSPSLTCGMWQYTSGATIAGISGRVDANISYRDYPNLIANLKNKRIEATTEDGYSPSIDAIYYPIPNYAGNSIIDALKMINVDSSYSFREKIAIKNGITQYTGTSSQNLYLLNLLIKGLLKKI